MWTELDQWEELLKSEIAEGDMLLGELGFAEDDLEEIADLLRRGAFRSLANASVSFDDILSRVERRWPLTFALYLVLEGVYNYSRDDHTYWQGPKDRLGIEDNQTSSCGQLFLRTLVRHNLPAFELTRGRRYVTRILLHGGVPTTALEEFFDYLLRHETQPHQIVVDSQTLLAEWRANHEFYLAGLSKPVSRFLRHGGRVAEDFVDRCLELLRAEDAGMANDLGLPGRVLDAYWPWRESHTLELLARPSGARIRLQRPFITVDPYRTGPSVHLPAQQFPSRLAPEELVWLLSADASQPQRIATERQRIENGYQYIADDASIIAPASEYTIALAGADGQPLQSWRLPGVSSPPVMVFDPYDDYEADALSDDERWRPGPRWLLYPREQQVQGPPQSEKKGDLPRLPGQWSAYRLEKWELAPGEHTLVDERGHVAARFEIIQEKSRRRPYLDGGELPLAEHPGEEVPIYSGHPPTLVIHTARPGRWRLSVRAAGNATPAGMRSFSVRDLTHTCIDGVTRVELGEPELLGPQPVGRFEVTVRGPLGHSRVFGLRVVPHLAIYPAKAMYVDPPDEAAEFELYCDLSGRVRQSPPQEGVTLQETTVRDNARVYTVSAGADIQHLALLLAHDNGVNIPFVVPIPRLSWRVVEGEQDPPWQTQALSLFPGALGDDAELQLRIPQLAHGPHLDLGWQVVDSEDKVWRDVWPGSERTFSQTALPMTEFLDLWRERQATLCCRLQLAIEGRDDLYAVDALYLLPRLELGDMLFEWREDGDNVQLGLCWANPQLGRLQLRLWPLDRPWVDQPLEPRAAVEAESIEVQVAKEQLPAEAYLGEIVPYNPWESRRPQRPLPNDPNTLMIKPPGLEDHYAELALYRDEGLAEPADLVALLMHQFHNGEQGPMYDTIRAMGQLAMDARWLVRCLDAAESLQDRTAYKILQMNLVKQASMERLAEEEVPVDLLERLEHHMPENLPSTVYQAILEAGPRELRHRALETLAAARIDAQNGSRSSPLVVEGVLNEFSAGSLLLQQAVALLSASAADAAPYLADQHSQDAAELLAALSDTTALEPSWVSKGMLLNTNLGPLWVESLRERSSNRPWQCARLQADAYVEGKLYIEPDPTEVRLDLRNRLLTFVKHEPFQCPQCERLYTTLGVALEHQKVEHPGGHLSKPKQVKKNEKLAELAATYEDNP